MNILVTGGKGFIGERLVEELVIKGHEVKVFDIADRQNITDSGAVEKALRGVDVVYHLAAELDENSPDLFKVNIEGTRNVLEASAKQRIKRFIFLSSCGVMGDIKGKVNESAPLNPKTAYEKSKAEAEKLVLSYQEVLPVIVVRSALVYGPNKYCADIINFVKKDFPLIGGGKNKFQMIYVKDLVEALAFLLNNGEIGEIYIVAEEKASTLKEIHSEIAKQLGVKMSGKKISVFTAKIFATLQSIFGKKSVVTVAHIDRLVRERNYSIEKINSLGWKPKYSLEEGLLETIAELRTRKLI